MDFFRDRGRLPFEDELGNAHELVEVFGSVRRAFRIILTVTNIDEWNLITKERTRDLLVYLALAQFDGRPAFGQLPLGIQRDVKAFLSSYKNACAKADDILFSLGKQDVVTGACQASNIGKLTPTALYVHESAIAALSPTLRLYEGCAHGYLGRVEGANVVKLHRNEPKISYLTYPSFQELPHPELAFSVTVHLQTFRLKRRSYISSRNRPILHRKELLVSPDHPRHEMWARLTRIEETKGLFENTDRIGLKNGWNEVLSQKGLYLKGHRLLAVS